MKELINLLAVEWLVVTWHRAGWGHMLLSFTLGIMVGAGFILSCL